MVCKRIIDLFTENHVVGIDKCRYLWYTTSITIKQSSRKEHKMIVTKITSKSQAKLELFKIDRRIEKKIEQHVNELGKHNTDIVERELEQLWAKKSILVSYINS